MNRELLCPFFRWGIWSLKSLCYSPQNSGLGRGQIQILLCKMVCSGQNIFKFNNYDLGTCEWSTENSPMNSLDGILAFTEPPLGEVETLGNIRSKLLGLHNTSLYSHVSLEQHVFYSNQRIYLTSWFNCLPRKIASRSTPAKTLLGYK